MAESIEKFPMKTYLQFADLKTNKQMIQKPNVHNR